MLNIENWANIQWVRISAALFELQINVSARRVKARANGVNVVLNTLLIDERHSKGQLHSALCGEVQAKLTIVKLFEHDLQNIVIYTLY